MKELLTLNNFACGYRDGFQISGISFSLSKGSFTGIIGPNGSGKTTLFRGISGDLPVSAGSFLFKGKEIGRAHV